MKMRYRSPPCVLVSAILLKAVRSLLPKFTKFSAA